MATEYNYNYAEMARSMYNVIKVKSKWNALDASRVAEMTEILKKEIAKVKRNTKNRAMTELAKIKHIDAEELTEQLRGDRRQKQIVEIAKSEDLQVFDQPTSLLERLIAEQDESFDKQLGETIPESELKPLRDINIPAVFDIFNRNENAVEENIDIHEEIVIDNDSLKRFHIRITCTAINSKPKVQIFKNDDIIEKEFLTDAILDHKLSFDMCIDANNLKQVRQSINHNFTNLSIVDHKILDVTEIPIQYQAIWQNRTTI